jgi:RNA polymerase primary sigma factor
MPRPTTRRNDDPPNEEDKSASLSKAPLDGSGRTKKIEGLDLPGGEAANGAVPPVSTSATSASRSKRQAAGVEPLMMLDDDDSDSTYDRSAGDDPGLDISSVDDLDMAERFDLGDTHYSRSGHRSGDSIVEAIDEAYDTLGLPETEDLITKIDRVSAAPKRNGRGSPLGEVEPVLEEVVETEEILEVEVMEDLEEGEPDAAELARTATEAEVVEVERPEDLERFIDRVLSMESVSVDDPVRIYLREIGRTALLKSPDESALAEKLALGHLAAQELEAHGIDLKMLDGPDSHYIPPDEETRAYVRTYREGRASKQRLVQANLRLVVSIARRYIGRGLSLLDLIQEGNIGLMKAADKFDHHKGFKFSTYATWWIRQAITRAISDQSRTIRLPVHVTEMVTRLRRAAHELQQKLLREPTEEELGQSLGMPAERVRKILDMARHPASLDAPMEEGEDSFLGDFIEDERTGGPEEEASRQMLKEQVDDILRKLTDREREILTMRYGLKDDRPRTLEEVAKEFGITRERIRQIETRILRKLRYARYGASKLRGYLD